MERKEVKKVFHIFKVILLDFWLSRLKSRLGSHKLNIKLDYNFVFY